MHLNGQKKTLRIAQVAPLYKSVPPGQYGGTERVVSYLTEELVRRGHEVTLFATGDSRTKARLESLLPSPIGLNKKSFEEFPYHLLLAEQVHRKALEFDIIHSHVDYVLSSLARRHSRPVVSTLHGRLDLPDLAPFYSEYNDIPLVSISNAQRAPLPWAHWAATVYHGLPEDLYSYSLKPGKYLAFLGRISPEKRPDRAIEIALRCGIPLKMAAKIDRRDQPYFDNAVRPYLGHPLIDFLGEIPEEEKNTLLAGALATLFPIDWPEPFGLVMIESLACGTPVIAARCGSVPEILEDGVTGFICPGTQEAVAAVQNIHAIDRGNCRRAFEQRFTVSKMTDAYLSVYHKLLRPEETIPLVRHYSA